MADNYNQGRSAEHVSTLQQYDDGTFIIENWYKDVEGSRIKFTVDKDSTLHISNAYTTKEGYYYVTVNEKAEGDDVHYAVFYPGEEYSKLAGNTQSGILYLYAFIYNKQGKLVEEGYYWFQWGNPPHPKLVTPDERQSN